MSAVGRILAPAEPTVYSKTEIKEYRKLHRNGPLVGSIRLFCFTIALTQLAVLRPLKSVGFLNAFARSFVMAIFFTEIDSQIL